LNEDQRSALEELRPKSKKATGGIPCKIVAGYKDHTSLIWLGDLRSINSERDGPDWVTKLESGDGEKAHKNARINVSYGAKTPIDTALRAMVRALGVGEGNLAKVAAQLKLGGAGKLFSHGVVVSGNVAVKITDFARSADLEWSIQDGTIQFLNRGKALSTKAIVVSADTGMIGSPTVDNDGVLSVKLLMIPDIRPGTLLVVKAERIKGNYRIEKATWSGDTFGSDWYVECEAKRY
jgi:hypothetical protein